MHEKILHLNSYFIDNKLYALLYNELSNRISQKVFIPIKTNRKPSNQNLVNTNVKLVFARLIMPNMKVFYRRKINTLKRYVIENKLYERIDFIHAHNLFTDGAIAFELFKEYEIPYIVAIRLTDIFSQYRFMFHRRKLIHKVLLNSKQVIFISEMSKDSFFKMLPDYVKTNISRKSCLIPNGIDNFWLNNKYQKKSGGLNINEVKLLFVGRIIKIKNIESILKVVELLISDGIKTKLTIIGGVHQTEVKYGNIMIEKLHQLDCVNYLGEIQSREKLMIKFRENDIFIMPSFKELFGVVYVEALSQGLPIIYSQNRGIDGIIEDSLVGYKVNPFDICDIKNKVKKIISNYEIIISNISEVANNFDWKNISNRYMQLYNEQACHRIEI